MPQTWDHNGRTITVSYYGTFVVRMEPDQDDLQYPSLVEAQAAIDAYVQAHRDQVAYPVITQTGERVDVVGINLSTSALRTKPPSKHDGFVYPAVPWIVERMAELIRLQQQCNELTTELDRYILPGRVGWGHIRDTYTQYWGEWVGKWEAKTHAAGERDA
ncbi:hypothetical protein LCGC14_2563720 [marine sediment metagenome]|uniref:Uncharacterized protein n=1 Tax=marine sediment metagenome TaxID=412755 RepID=A0A0F9AJT2_9ZZZZ